jgi:hypothetical protein
LIARTDDDKPGVWARELIMPIVMQFVQRFDSSNTEEFMELEKRFAALEQRGILPKGERMSPIAGREPGNTLIWQGRFASLAEAAKALDELERSPQHAQLLKQQKPFFQDSWVEFYRVLEGDWHPR